MEDHGGTGKSFLVCKDAIDALKSGKVKKIVLTRSMVEAGRPMGYLPGSMEDKIQPYLIPLLDNLEQIVGQNRVEEMLENGVIVFEPINFLRGRNLRDSYIILDEAQNLDKTGLKLFLTRICEGSKVAVTYDPSQVDLRDRTMSCIEHIPFFAGKKNIGHFMFSNSDVIRSELVSTILEAYEEIENEKV